MGTTNPLHTSDAQKKGASNKSSLLRKTITEPLLSNDSGIDVQTFL
jgi:hypothetical protein